MFYENYENIAEINRNIRTHISFGKNSETSLKWWIYNKNHLYRRLHICNFVISAFCFCAEYIQSDKTYINVLI